MANQELILRINLLNEFIESDLRHSQDNLQEKIALLFEEMESYELSEEENQTLVDLKKSYQQRKSKNKESPLTTVRERALKRAFLKYRGLVFDLKTRFDYSSSEVAIQDGLDLSEYFREVIEEINNDLNECLMVENQKLSRVRDDLSQFYGRFSRKRLKEIYPDIAETFKVFREVLDELGIAIS